MSSSGRLEGVDLARALAIVGMLMVHVGPLYGDSLGETLYALPHGRASVLFMLVAGVSVSLLARARRDAPGALSGHLLWRAMLLLPAGLVLQVIDEGRLVILQTYAAMFVLAIGAVRLSSRWLLAIVGLVAIAGPVAFLYGRMVAPVVFNRSAVAWGQAPDEILHGLLLSGPYPLMTWIVPFFTGMWLGRRDLHDARVRTRLVLGGAGAAFVFAGAGVVLQDMIGGIGFQVSWAQLLSLLPHSQMPLWLASSTASAAGVVGLALIAAELHGRSLRPLIVLGQLALTFYVAHLLALTAWPGMLETGDVGEAVWICLLFTGVAASLALGWRALLPKGPLELLLQPPWLALRRRSPARR